MNSILEYEIFQKGEFVFLLQDLLNILTLMMGVVLSLWAFKWAMNRFIYSKINIDSKKQSFVNRAFVYSIFFLSFLTILHIVGVPIRSFLDLVESFFSYKLFSIREGKDITIINLILVGLAFLLARVGIWSIQEFLSTSVFSKRVKMDTGRKFAVFQIVKYLIYLLAILLVLANLGLDISVLAAGSAAFFVVIGLGLQNIFNDILSGIILLFDGTIEVGDVIEVDDLFGKVREIQLRRSVIETPDLVSIIVPNSTLTAAKVINWSHSGQETRFKLTIGVAYGSDVSLVRKILKESAFSHSYILNKPEPRVWFSDFGDSSLVFSLLFWVEKAIGIEGIKSDIRFKIEADFRRYGIQIPFPQRDLHIVSDYRYQKPESTKKEETS